MPLSSGGGMWPARMLTWIDGISSFGVPSVASLASRIATYSSSLIPSRTCGFSSRCAPTVVRQAYSSRPGAL